MKSRHFFFWVLALLGMSIVPAHAATSFCVTTSQELQLDLSLAAKNKGDNVIKIVRSATPYTLTTVGYYQAYGALSVLGGYAPGCATRVVDPANTVIDFGGTSVLFQTFYAPSNSLLQFDGLTLQHGAELTFSVGSYNCCIPDEAGNLRVTNSRITGFSATLSYANFETGTVEFNGTSAHMLLSNLVIDHIVQNGKSKCAVSVSVEGDNTIQASYLSVDLAGGKPFCFESDGTYGEDGTFHFDVYNSIFWSSDGSNFGLLGIQNFGSIEVNLVNDIFHDYQGDGAVTYKAPLAPAQSDPLWVDAANGNFHLAANQPGAVNAAINSGALSVPFGFTSRDIEGSQRPVGSHPDRGAYESPYSDADLFTVTNTSDCATLGCGSLRRAMIDANNSTAATTSIRFSIPVPGNPNVGLCPAVIDIGSSLPDITKPMLINGYTQSGSEPNADAYAFDATLCTIVEPANSTYYAFKVPETAGSDVALYLAGIAVGSFPVGVVLLGGANHQIVGNQFGGYVNNFGYQLYGATVAAVYANVTNGKFIIGGDEPANRNVFLNSESFGKLPAAAILIGSTVNASAGDCQILGNTIGVQDDGTFASTNTDYGIYLYGNGCRMHGNRIVGVIKDAIDIDASLGGGNNNIVQNNTLGLVPYGFVFSTNNGGAGIRVSGSHNTIGASSAAGGVASVDANLIEYMSDAGVVVSGNGTGNTIRGNVILYNGPNFDAMGIDLRDDGPTPNDVADSDSGPNNLQNYPVLHAIAWPQPPTVNGQDIPATLHGSLRSFIGPGAYRIDAYYADGCDAFGRGIAQKWIGNIDGVTIAAGTLTTAFNLPLAIPSYAPNSGMLSLTATNALEGSTSELSKCFSVDTIFKDGVETE